MYCCVDVDLRLEQFQPLRRAVARCPPPTGRCRPAIRSRCAALHAACARLASWAYALHPCWRDRLAALDDSMTTDLGVIQHRACSRPIHSAGWRSPIVRLALFVGPAGTSRSRPRFGGRRLRQRGTADRAVRRHQPELDARAPAGRWLTLGCSYCIAADSAPGSRRDRCHSRHGTSLQVPQTAIRRCELVAISSNCRQLAGITGRLQERDQVGQRQDADAPAGRRPPRTSCTADFATLAPLLAVERDHDAGRRRAGAADDVDGLPDRRAGRDHVVDDQHAAAQRRADDAAAFAVVLGFLAVEGPGQAAAVMLGQRRGRSRDQRECPCRPARTACRRGDRERARTASRRSGRAPRWRRPVLNSPALKKYGLLRPDFSVNSPKRRTPRSRQSWMKEVWCIDC